MDIERQINTIGWDRLRYFYYVAKVGSLSDAEKLLNLTQSNLSRTIQNLEERIGYKLFIRWRGPRKGLLLTEQGEILFNACKKIFADIETALIQIDKEKGEPQGPIRIRSTGGLVNSYLLKYIPAFLKLYPKITFTFIAKDPMPEFDFAEADVAIRPAVPGQPNLVQRYLFTNHIRLYASPDYLKKFGTPTYSKDLDYHRLIGFGRHQDAYDFQSLNWHLTVGAEMGQVRLPFIEVNTPLGRIQLASQGLGIAAISREHPGLEDYNLIEVLPDLPGETVETYYIYPMQLKDSKRIQILGDYLAEALKKDYG